MGQLYLVSAGPGDLDLMTPKATQALNACTDFVAYGLYFEYLGGLCDQKKLHALPLGQEIERARLALELAAAGKSTALLSSGDIGIYAMASLVFELLERDQQLGAAAEWRDVEIEVIPGITAVQAASSHLGALLGHDFCTISLSDLLTPWATIEKRIQAAAIGDFVTAFYNPKSQKRDWQLEKAKAVFLQHRSPDTPVALCKQLTRPDQNIHWTRLSSLETECVDMFTLVCIGNSQTRSFNQGDRKWLFTPRGYDKKTK